MDEARIKALYRTATARREALLDEQLGEDIPALLTGYGWPADETSPVDRVAASATASTITRGHFCNPMNQAWLSMPGVAGLATLYRTLGGQSDLRVERELESLLGSGLLACLREDSGRFVQQGLDGLSPAARELLLRRYAAQPGPAAAELCAWLREEYRFDPACLTD